MKTYKSYLLSTSSQAHVVMFPHTLEAVQQYGPSSITCTFEILSSYRAALQLMVELDDIVELSFLFHSYDNPP